MRRLARSSGLTLLEVIIASLVVAVVAGGTMMAFIASANMSGPYSMSGAQDLSTLGEANDLAQQTIESFRNEVEANPGPTNKLTTKVGLGWQANNPAPPAVGTDTASKLTGVKRCYRVIAATCAVGEPCYEVQTQVCWNTLTTCNCP